MIWQHYRHRAGDGAGLVLGEKPGGTVLVAVTGTARAWADWLAEKGPTREPGRYSSVSWQPPPSALRTTGVAVGGDELNKAAETMRGRNIGANERGWMVWAVPPSAAGISVRFPSRRKLGQGLDVLGSGHVPWHLARPDGWTTKATRVPVVEALPPWLADALGARCTKGGAR